MAKKALKKVSKKGNPIRTVRPAAKARPAVKAKAQLRKKAVWTPKMRAAARSRMRRYWAGRQQKPRSQSVVRKQPPAEVLTTQANVRELIQDLRTLATILEGLLST